MCTTKLSPTPVTGLPSALISIPELSMATCPCGSHSTRKTADGSASIVRWTSIRSLVTSLVTCPSCHQAAWRGSSAPARAWNTVMTMNPLSGVLGEAWQLYRKFAAHLLAVAFVIYLAAAIVAALLSLAGPIGVLLALIVELFAGFLLQATLVKAVQDIRDGRADLSLRETVSAATPYIWSVAGASILAGIAIAVGLVLLIVPGLWLITIWAVIIPVIVIERSGALASFGRSRQLVRGHGWHVFGTLVVVFIILIVVDLILGIIFAALPIV